MSFACEFDFVDANHSVPVGEFAVRVGVAVIDNAQCAVGALHNAIVAWRRNAFLSVSGKEGIVIVFLPWTKRAGGFGNAYAIMVETGVVGRVGHDVFFAVFYHPRAFVAAVLFPVDTLPWL